MAHAGAPHPAAYCRGKLHRCKERRTRRPSGTPAADERQPDHTEYRQPCRGHRKEIFCRQGFRKCNGQHQSARGPVTSERDDRRYCSQQARQSEGPQNIS